MNRSLDVRASKQDESGKQVRRLRATLGQLGRERRLIPNAHGFDVDWSTIFIGFDLMSQSFLDNRSI